MTNGEKMIEVFPSIELYKKTHDGILINFDSTWWNAEYKEPTNKNDLRIAYISRKSVIDELKRYFHDEYYQRTSIQDCRDCFIEDVLIHLPSVTPQEPRKGHWICDGKGRNFADYHCSECGLKLALCGQDIKQRQDSGYSLFCGGCGADMRGNENEID